MSKCWLMQARRHCPQWEIVVLHDREIPEIKDFARRFSGVRFEHFDRSLNDIVHPGSGPMGSMAQNFKIPFLQHVHNHKWDPFVFVDADALIVGDIADLAVAVTDKPFVATTEARVRWRPEYKICNTAVFAYRSSSNLLSHEALRAEWLSTDRVIKFPTGEQGLIVPYLYRIGYNWEHPLIGPEYNTFSDAANVQQADDNGIVVTIDDGPAQGTIVADWIRAWIGWGCRREARIVHAISHWKWWNCPKTEKLWSFLTDKVRSLEHVRV